LATFYQARAGNTPFSSLNLLTSDNSKAKKAQKTTSLSKYRTFKLNS